MPLRQILWGRKEPAPYMSARDRARALNDDNFLNWLGLTQLMSFCVGADDSLPENILYKGLKLPLRAA